MNAFSSYSGSFLSFSYYVFLINDVNVFPIICLNWINLLFTTICNICLEIDNLDEYEENNMKKMKSKLIYYIESRWWGTMIDLCKNKTFWMKYYFFGLDIIFLGLLLCEN